MRVSICCLLTLVTLSIKAQTLDIQGHRGARGLLPENTIRGFLRAIDEGVTTLEMDVVITEDKQIVVSHEPYMSPAICLDPKARKIKSAKDYNIYQLTYSEVALFDCGILGNRRFPKQEKVSTNKPLLEEVINTVEFYLKENNLPNVAYNIELKSSASGDGIYHPGVDEFSDIVAGLLQEKLDNARYTIQCFDFRILKYWHERYPDTTLVALVENATKLEESLETLGFTPSVYSPNHSRLTAAIVKASHDRSMKVIPWTVNDLARMKKLVEMGVDGIITDYPDRAKALK